MKTLDEVCDQPSGSFRKYLQHKSEYLKNQAAEQAKRIRSFLCQKNRHKFEYKKIRHGFHNQHLTACKYCGQIKYNYVAMASEKEMWDEVF